MTRETNIGDWDKLKEEFEGNIIVKYVTLLALKKEFELLKMKD